MTDAIAVKEGFTKEVVVSNGECDLYLLVRPDTDFDGTFKAWDTDAQEFIKLYGWLFVRVDGDNARDLMPS